MMLNYKGGISLHDINKLKYYEYELLVEKLGDYLKKKEDAYKDAEKKGKSGSPNQNKFKPPKTPKFETPKFNTPKF